VKGKGKSFFLASDLDTVPGDGDCAELLEQIKSASPDVARLCAIEALSRLDPIGMIDALISARNRLGG
jgi:hypothetical protein